MAVDRAVLGGGTAVFLLENRDEVAQGGEPQPHGDGQNIKIAGGEQIGGILQPQIGDELLGGHADLAFHDSAQVSVTKAGIANQSRQPLFNVFRRVHLLKHGLEHLLVVLLVLGVILQDKIGQHIHRQSFEQRYQLIPAQIDIQQIMLFLNKRGYAGFISCRSCGYVMKCPHCDISLTAHNNGRLVCHYCGYQTGSVKLCPKCGSRYISGFKAGTQQVEEMLKKTFPGIRVLRMDMDTTSGKDGHEKIISEFAAHNADVLVGTQMIVKGHDFPDVTLVGVLAADMSLYTSDFRAGERTFQLLVQAAGRAGRKNLHGDVIIQTYTPDNYSIVAAQKQDYEMFYDDEILFRKLMGYPPVMHMLEVKISSKNEGNLEKSCDDMKKFSDMADDKKLFITGPVVPQVYKLNDIYTQVLYVKAAEYERLTQFKDNIEVHVKDNILYKNVSVQFNFD